MTGRVEAASQKLVYHNSTQPAQTQLLTPLLKSTPSLHHSHFPGTGTTVHEAQESRNFCLLLSQLYAPVPSHKYVPKEPTPTSSHLSHTAHPIHQEMLSPQ